MRFPRVRAMRGWGVWLAMTLASAVSATPPALLHTPGYQSPVQGGPNDLLTITGRGFHSTDRVVYRASDTGDRPREIPERSGETEGVASIVKLGDPPESLTVRLPGSLNANRAYRLWVVNDAQEWSQPVSINDPRPLWFSPAYLYSTDDFAGLGRTLRVIGRNLGMTGDMRIRLKGRQTYVIRSQSHDHESVVQDYVTEGALPGRLEPGIYSVAVSPDGESWVAVPGQQLEVRRDPAISPARFDLSKPEYGNCHPDDESDDSECLRKALAAAARAGAGILFLPAGTWDVDVRQLQGDERQNGFILPHNVSVQGAGSKLTHLIRHAAKETRAPGALFSLTGANSVTGISFTDAVQYESLQQSRATLQLGTRPAAGSVIPSQTVDDIIIAGNAFYHVGRAVTDSSLPLKHLFVTRNEFGGYDNGLLLTGGGASVSRPYRIDDAVVRWNRFVPGSYLDISARQGTIASQLGAAHRLDFSSNIADGTSPQGLQQLDDHPGWRAAFFWNLNNNQEEVLVAENQVGCAGDKAGDGEAIAFDSNGDTFGLDQAAAVEAAGASWVRVRARLRHQHFGQPVPVDYYRGHWVFAAESAGAGQARRLESYTENPDGTITLRVAPDWDIPPDRARVVIGTLYWQVYVVANDVTQAKPPCKKSNLTDPRGGLIGFWAPVADSVIEGNTQKDTDGIGFLLGYSAHAVSCPTCLGSASFVSSLEIRGNVIDGEYDWSSDCSWSGIRGYFVATPTPEAPPPLLGSGVVIAHNTISHADGPRGGAIEFAAAGKAGPDPGNWTMLQNPLIFGNDLQDIGGELPRAACRRGQRGRVGIRVEGNGNVRGTILDANRCKAVDTLLEDSGADTARICSPQQTNSCECAVR